MRIGVVALLISVLATAQADEAGSLIKLESTYDVATTANRLEAALENKGMGVFARINHAAGAEKVGKELRPTELLIFGNPKAGTLLMQCDQHVAIELPQKALIWEDTDGKTWLGYQDPAALAEHYQMHECQPVLEKVRAALGGFAKTATAAE